MPGSSGCPGATQLPTSPKAFRCQAALLVTCVASNSNPRIEYGKDIHLDLAWRPKGHKDTSLRLSTGITSHPTATPQGFLNMYFLTSLLTPVAVETELSQQGPFLLGTDMQAVSEGSYPHIHHSTGIIPPQLCGWSCLLCTLLLSATVFEGWMETKAHYSPWESASNRGSGRPGRQGAVDGGGIYNLCLVPARLDAHSRFPPYNKIKQLWDISLLLADEILASADLLRPAWGCSLFLCSKTWRAAAAVSSAPKLGICSFFPPHSPPFSELMCEGYRTKTVAPSPPQLHSLSHF